MEKKYTVFISSTYTDLKEERQKVLDVVLQSDCIPVGMEYFPAADDEQFAIIRKLIDDCDFYVLIIGGRYGSVNPTIKISYTEMEYDYAVSQGVPILVFEHKNVIGLPDDKRDSDLTALDNFKLKARGSRMAKMWDSHEELIAGVIIALNNAKKTYDRPGWTRGTQYDNTELLTQINQLRLENEALKQEKTLILSNIDHDGEIAFYGEEVNLHFTERHYVWTSNTITHEYNKMYTLDDIFKVVSLRLLTPASNNDLFKAFEALESGFYVDEQPMLEIRAQFYALGLVEINVDKKGQETTVLTEKGKIEMQKLNVKMKNNVEV